MKKPSKRRPADANMRMHSIMQDIRALTDKPIKAPTKSPRRRKRA